jgi:hypothetical protein
MVCEIYLKITNFLQTYGYFFVSYIGGHKLSTKQQCLSVCYSKIWNVYTLMLFSA